MNRARISNITQTKNGTETEKIKKGKMDKIPSRTQIWNKYISSPKEKMIKWAHKTKTSQLTIDNIIKDNTWGNSDKIKVYYVNKLIWSFSKLKKIIINCKQLVKKLTTQN